MHTLAVHAEGNLVPETLDYVPYGLEIFRHLAQAVALAGHRQYPEEIQETRHLGIREYVGSGSEAYGTVPGQQYEQRIHKGRAVIRGEYYRS